MLGAWWSRYWPYTAEELEDIAHGYWAHSIPLDMIVSDMAWHYHNETPIDWAGYAWSKALFPNPAGFQVQTLTLTPNTNPNSNPNPNPNPNLKKKP